MGAVRRILATLATAATVLVLGSSPAGAHSAGGAEATNFLTRLSAVEPPVAGIEVAVIEGGNRLRLTNTGPEEALVIGYQGEPYLRVGPDGVFENLRSPTTYLNRDRQASAAVPDTADPEAAPEWSRVDRSATARWHDHRIHWMGERNPPAVRDDPGRRQAVIPEWVVPIEVGDTVIEAKGELLWVPGPSPVPWFALAGALLGVTLYLGNRRRWRTPVVVLLGAAVVLDVVHALGAGFSVDGSTLTRLGVILNGSYISVLGWVAAGIGVVAILGHRRAGLYLAGSGALFVALNGGLLDLATLSRSQLPFAGPDAVARLAVAVVLGAGGGVVVTLARRAVALPASPTGEAAAG